MAVAHARPRSNARALLGANKLREFSFNRLLNQRGQHRAERSFWADWCIRRNHSNVLTTGHRTSSGAERRVNAAVGLRAPRRWTVASCALSPQRELPATPSIRFTHLYAHDHAPLTTLRCPMQSQTTCDAYCCDVLSKPEPREAM